MEDIELTGDIRKFEYDEVVDLERIEFRDTNYNYNINVEIPRSVTSFQDKSQISVKITDKLQNTDYKPDVKIVFNSILYMVRQDAKSETDAYIIQFSAGGFVLQIITETGKSRFRLRGNRKYRLIVS
ncbi:MAG: hypothetical protein ACXAC7_02950 [Candidatus Hodarchaeales archaeon]|jgi:hypothetical protein